MRTIDKIITRVPSERLKYGAPMGRHDVGHYPHTITSGPNCKIFKKHQKKVFDCAVPLNNGGYDRGGVYWGCGNQLRVEYTKDLTYIKFYRK